MHKKGHDCKGRYCGCDAAQCWYVLTIEMVEVVVAIHVVAAILVLVLVTVHCGTCSLM